MLTKIPDKAETLELQEKIKKGQPVDNIAYLRGVIHMGALAHGLSPKEALEAACTPELDGVKVNFIVEFVDGK